MYNSIVLIVESKWIVWDIRIKITKITRFFLLKLYSNPDVTLHLEQVYM